MDNSLPLSRRDLLRRTTSDAHARIDRLLSGGLADRGDYGRYLRGMHRFVRQAQVVLHGDDSAPSLAQARDCLDIDLDCLGLGPLASAPVAAEAQLPMRLGWHYVVAGSSLGARLLLRDARALGLDGTRGARFLAHHACGHDWQDFLLRLDQAPLGTGDLPSMCEAAGRAFAVAHAAMNAARQEETA